MYNNGISRPEGLEWCGRSVTLLGHFLASAPKPLSVGVFNHTIGISAGQQGIKCM